ncbi:MAG TPA: hypothetical protein VGM76_00540 [Lacipirellulaceae bacterium]
MYLRACCAIAACCWGISFSLLAAAANPSSADNDQAADSATGTSVPQPKKRLTAQERIAARRAPKPAANQPETPEEHRQRLARLAANGVEPWPAESAGDHAEALARSRKMISEVLSLLPGMRVYETDHFFFVSNITSDTVAPYIRSLDKMYDSMCELYGVRAGTPVWLGGKAPVFAFKTQEQFSAFEQKYFEVPARDSQHLYGICHQSSRGDVVIACFQGEDANDFGQMLVHETSHGFIHRYKTKARLPSWVNEGMADVIGAEMVPKSMAVKTKEKSALAILRERHSLGGDFFTAEPIHDWQYGVASSLTRFLMETDRQSYVRFIEGLKAGQKWPIALERAYNGTPDQLVTQYGQSIGVPDLRP